MNNFTVVVKFVILISLSPTASIANWIDSIAHYDSCNIDSCGNRSQSQRCAYYMRKIDCDHSSQTDDNA